jgi:cell division protein FtsL
MIIAAIIISCAIIFLAMSVLDIATEIARSNELKEIELKSMNLLIPPREDD